MAGIIQHTWTLPGVYTLLLYLYLFGVLETVVVIIHRDKLATGAALTVPYLITHGLTVAAALAYRVSGGRGQLTSATGWPAKNV
jgi:hypothetical protein